MKKEIKSLALIGLMTASASAFTIDASELDEWGLVGSEKSSIVVPDADVFSGGNSAVLDPAGGVIGKCAESDASCTDNWNMSSTFQEVDFAVDYFSSQLKVTDFVPSSKAGWGWATAGWWVVPDYDKTRSGETAFDKSAPIGLTADDWMTFVFSYTAGQTLTLQLKGGDIDENDGSQSPPRFNSFEASGSFKQVTFPMKAVKRAGWSVPATYDASQVTGLGFLRMEAALAEGAKFPSDAPEMTTFSFKCLASGASKAEAEGNCAGSGVAILGAVGSMQVETMNNSVAFHGVQASFQAEIVSVNGEVLRTAEISSASNSISTDGLSQGAYFVKAQGEALRIVK